MKRKKKRAKLVLMERERNKVRERLILDGNDLIRTVELLVPITEEALKKHWRKSKRLGSTYATRGKGRA